MSTRTDELTAPKSLLVAQLRLPPQRRESPCLAARSRGATQATERPR
ncbi:MAG: hypothetical protein ACHP7M_04710 [Burkholderiales bacterium]|jgi:hypothetical protein